MKRGVTSVVLVAPLVFGAVFGAVAYTASSGRSEGRPNGMRYASVVEDVNRHEEHLVGAARLFSIDPRMLGSAIAAERANNFLPYVENFIDAVFGTSVGFAQINTVAYRENLSALYESGVERHFRLSAASMDTIRNYFARMRGLKRYERKFLLLFDSEMNIAAAAMILRHSLDRYDALAPQFGVFRRPDLAATLYHCTFPDSIRGLPDAFGELALKFYHDPSFMPRCSKLNGMANHDK